MDKIFEILKEKVNKLEIDVGDVEVLKRPSEALRGGPSPKKMKRAVFDELKELAGEDSDEEYVCTLEEEFKEYVKDRKGKSTERSPLCFWKENFLKFPRLAVLARILLALPATSGSVERLFSLAVAIARSRRSRITVKNLEKILICFDQLREIEKNRSMLK